MNVQEILEKWTMAERDTTPLWKLAVYDIEYEGAEDPTDGVEIAALAENIRQIGMLHPILVMRQKKGKKYRLISGRRRLQAIMLLGRSYIAAIVVKCDSITPLQIVLSENMMRKPPHFLDLAQDTQTLLKEQSASKTARLFTVTESFLQDKLKLASLSPYEKRLIRLLKLTENDALELCKIENATLRKLLLEKIMESGSSCDSSELIKQAAKSPDFRLTRSAKVYVHDIRIFLNTVERAIEMMKSAGFTASIEKLDEDDSYEFRIKVSKSKVQPGVHHSNSTDRPSVRSKKDVSRETLCVHASPWAIDRTNVSRETFENIKLPIDESSKS